MKEIDIESWQRTKTYNWFNTFTNTTYSCNVIMDVTNLVEHTKKTKESFFIDMLYITVSGLNSIEEMRMRIVNDKPVLFDDINPAFTVMTEGGTFENARFDNNKEFKEFYNTAEEIINNTKKQSKIKKENYNPENCWNEYYITCLPWVSFTSISHPMPDNKASQCIPRICWDKYRENNGKYELTLNITVSHLFVDGFPLAAAFNKIQKLLDSVNEILK